MVENWALKRFPREAMNALPLEVPRGCLDTIQGFGWPWWSRGWIRGSLELHYGLRHSDPMAVSSGMCNSREGVWNVWIWSEIVNQATWGCDPGEEKSPVEFWSLYSQAWHQLIKGIEISLITAVSGICLSLLETSLTRRWGIIRGFEGKKLGLIGWKY